MSNLKMVGYRIKASKSINLEGLKINKPKTFNLIGETPESFLFNVGYIPKRLRKDLVSVGTCSRNGTEYTYARTLYGTYVEGLNGEWVTAEVR